MINSRWFKNYSGDREKLEETVRNGRFVLERLTEIIEQEIKEYEVSKVEDYDKVSWPYFRADRDGQLRSLRNILKLTNLKDQ